MSCCVIVSEYFSAKCRRTLENLGYDVISLRGCETLDRPICSHPDMLFSIIERDFIISESYYHFEKTKIDFIIESGNFNLLLSECVQKSPYPHDIAYNVLSINRCLIGNLNYVSPEVIKSAEFHHYTKVNVKQGYAACSTVKVNSSAIITADRGIAKAACEIHICDVDGCDVLCISQGHIKLNNYDYGFIGGASGMIDGKLYFSGAAENHPDYERMCEFCGKYGVDVVSLSDEDLYDFGGIIQIIQIK